MSIQKLSLSIPAILLCGIIAVVPTQAEPRCVLVEYFTEVECGVCPVTWAVLDTLTQFYSPESLAVIRYFPEKIDSLYGFYQPESGSRQGYYGAYFYPWAFFDGIEDVYQSYPHLYPLRIESRLAIPSPMSMTLTVTYDTLGRSVVGFFQVIASDSLPAGNLRLHYALIESDLTIGEDIHNQVLRDMFPNAQGINFTIGQGDTVLDTVAFTLDSLWLPENCDLVAFVQDHSTKEVFQSIRRPLYGPRSPAMVRDLLITKLGNFLSLAWSVVTKDKRGYPQPVDHYRIYRDTGRTYHPEEALLLDSTSGLSYLDDAAGYVGHTEVNSFYYVTAVAGGKESEPSASVGEIDTYLSPTK